MPELIILHLPGNTISSDRLQLFRKTSPMQDKILLLQWHFSALQLFFIATACCGTTSLGGWPISKMPAKVSGKPIEWQQILYRNGLWYYMPLNLIMLLHGRLRLRRHRQPIGLDSLH